MDSETRKPMVKTVNLKLVSEPKEIAEVALGIYVAQCIKSNSAPDPKAFLGINYTNFASGAKKYEYAIEVEGKKQDWVVVDTATHKFVLNRDGSYTQVFNKTTGFNARMGKNVEDDPSWCPLGPEIADIEVVTGSCPKVNSENCRWCYKNNTSAAGKVMTLEQFKKVVMAFPRNLSQVALGITGVKSNPYLTDMLKWLREYGIIGNLTLTGADLDDEMAENLVHYCGACAVSCYDKAKQLCYDTINKLHTIGREKFNKDMHVNMHIVIADFSMPHIMDVLNDIKDGKVPGLRSVVMLHAKPVGRAKNLDCSLSKENLTKVVKFCLDNKINCIFQKEGMSLYLDDGTENPFLAIFCSVISTCAKVERDSIKFRLNDARRRKIELALSSGKTLADVGFGRPKGSIKTKERKEQEYAATIKALKRGLSLRDAAKISNVSVSTCQRIKKEFAL